jgi:hypothetical protein
MHLLDKIKALMEVFMPIKGKIGPIKSGVIPYGKQKKDGSHDNRTSRGGDRTPSQKKGDKSRQK